MSLLMSILGLDAFASSSGLNIGGKICFGIYLLDYC